MKPIGLKYKNEKENPFTGRVTGEIMIVHKCTNCSHLSCNRVAGDDDPCEIIKLLGIESNKEKLNNIRLLTSRNKKEVLISLFGYNYPKDI